MPDSKVKNFPSSHGSHQRSLLAPMGDPSDHFERQLNYMHLSLSSASNSSGLVDLPDAPQSDRYINYSMSSCSIIPFLLLPF